LIVLNATFSNISWRLALVMEEAAVPWENHRPTTSTLFCNLQSRVRTSPYWW